MHPARLPRAARVRIRRWVVVHQKRVVDVRSRRLDRLAPPTLVVWPLHWDRLAPVELQLQLLSARSPDSELVHLRLLSPSDALATRPAYAARSRANSDTGNTSNNFSSR